MEVLPCSGIKYVGDSDCPQQGPAAAFIYDGEPNCLEPQKPALVADGEFDGILLNAERPVEEMIGEDQAMFNEVPTSEGHCSGASYFECEVEGQNLSCDSHDFEDENLDVQNHCMGACVASENSHLILETIEGELPSNNGDGESFLSETRWPEEDESVAVWVKWRGKWQAGIRCARADWPLSTVKAKPTHDRKKYFVIFFPRTRNYSWADVLLVRPISEFPQPIAYRSHNVGLKMVKDLTIARRFIMQKLGISMLNIIDQLHTEALLETARSVTVWKEFAVEASRCKTYFDLGRMLLKLQNMILQRYLNSEWLEHSLHSWAHHCQNAHRAESVEMLKEELNDSILWNEVHSLPDAPVQLELSSEWKTWKNEVMKWFSMSNPLSSGGDTRQQSRDSPVTAALQISRKRPKLEVRRAEAHATNMEKGSHPAITVGIDSGIFDGHDTVNHATLASDHCKGEILGEGVAPTENPGSASNRWDNIVVEAGNPEFMQSKDVESTPTNGLVARKHLNLGSKNRQCIAFIEAKGRQCVRWANEGDVYCCVHLASRFAGNHAKAEGNLPVDSPLCEGTTTLGTRCKHRSLCGSLFCKKHRPHDDMKKTLPPPENKLKRKHEEIISRSKSSSCKDIVLLGQLDPPIRVDPVSVMEGDAFNGRSCLTENHEYSSKEYNNSEMPCCIGSCPNDGTDPCWESPKRHSLYCEKHLPSWLKRARNGKSRIISKEVFIDLLKDCCSQEQKMQLHRACELFYRLFKSILSLRNPVPKEIQLQWAVSEASKYPSVGEFLMKLVCSEKERLVRLWGFNATQDTQISSSVAEDPVPMPLAIESGHDIDDTIRCKICSEEFIDDQALGTHWMDNHKKEAQWFFRGYACAICLDSFTNKKVLETHVQERHHVQFVENCMLVLCIPCGSHFGNTDQLWLHVLSAHPANFRPSKIAEHQTLSVDEDSPQKLELDNSASVENNTQSQGNFRKFVCRFCGLKFDLLPDLGRHHQAAHMGPQLVGSRPPKKGIHFYAHRLKSGRLTRPRFKKGLGAASYRIRNRSNATLKKRIQASHSAGTEVMRVQSNVTEAVGLGRLSESQCSSVAKILFSEIQKTKARPNNLEILSIARSACCRVNLQASLEGKYGVLPERLYLKAAKLCSEHNIHVNWHQEGFICPRGCKPVTNSHLRSTLAPPSHELLQPRSTSPTYYMNEDWEMDECHYVIDSRHFAQNCGQKTVILCGDISFGKESVPIACVVDKDFLDSLGILLDGTDGQITKSSMPWESFTYIMKPLLDQSLDLDAESLQLGCACGHSACYPETCDHVYLFDNDYEDARDIYGKPMHGRFPYDENGRLILEEGYLVYECSHMCSCSRTCQNRVLQNGVRVKLEVFKTGKKGWALRAGEAILRGTFVCEYIGEVLSEHEANERHNRYDKASCSYFYDIDAHISDMSSFIEGQVPYVIDATRYGNVSRFINHSCSPNLVNHQVLVESMEYQLAHVGLYASRDIAVGEELTYGYRFKLLPGQGCQCHCGASNCRGRLE
ncbi:histone-lysine N-methyltransferase SUVR5 [Malania oleifera]|uniref:histone-lysine N-methyltransferase SUVR5 n=1 Tax=Malania oleifera TaxID=397392 RepID=UPI0025AE3071|nr:histone-lysine N-methyltransferase SUVR5 [Malania oleifera]XP_057980680.1 histone-lysine N-methyltransferase SUVR5 [Malania oleifera]XP_057980687.1 histone-lysine N-methyltransferase SUVR5 [Malania oleifera]XP_057980696.1 histone-lysine N-methyltransferase SUVR5 [Malania oleifera]